MFVYFSVWPTRPLWLVSCWNVGLKPMTGRSTYASASAIACWVLCTLQGRIQMPPLLQWWYVCALPIFLFFFELLAFNLLCWPSCWFQGWCQGGEEDSWVDEECEPTLCLQILLSTPRDLSLRWDPGCHLWSSEVSTVEFYRVYMVYSLFLRSHITFLGISCSSLVTNVVNWPIWSPCFNIPRNKEPFVLMDFGIKRNKVRAKRPWQELQINIITGKHLYVNSCCCCFSRRTLQSSLPIIVH